MVLWCRTRLVRLTTVGLMALALTLAGRAVGPASGTLRGTAGGDEGPRRQLASSALTSSLNSSVPYIEGERVYQTWDSTYVVWSHVLAFVGAYVAFTTTMYMKQVSTTRWYWIMLVQAGFSLGICTVWSMHFVGMQALILQGGEESGSEEILLIGFEPSLTISSAVVAWFIATCALHTALGRKGSEVLNIFSGVSGGLVEKRSTLSHRKQVMDILKKLPARRIFASAVMLALAVCAMHYMGMLSQSGNFTMTYTAGIVLLSSVVAIIVSFAGLAIFFFLFDSIVYRTASAVIVSVAVNGMHYCGMASATYYAHLASRSGPFGKGQPVVWHLDAKLVMTSVLLLDLTLMAATGYYVEVLETVRKREGEEFEKELRHKSYIRGADELIRRSKVMRYPMCLLRYDTFMRLGKLVPHEALRDSNRLIYVNTVSAALKRSKKRFVVFFSHQWLSRKIPDPKNRQFHDMLNALKGLSTLYRVKLENMYVWVDYCSIPQEGADQQQLAIDSLATYATVSSAFVIIAPQVLHTETLTPCNFMTYSKRCWCRLEVFCSVLSSLRVKTASQSQASALVEEGEEDELTVIPEGSDHGGQTSARSLPVMPQGGGVTSHEHHRVFLVVDDQLHRLNFFTREGHLRHEYEELLFVFNGELECCSCGHVTADGKEMICDKMKVVETLSGCYGSMLFDLRRSRRKSAQDVDSQARKVLAEHIVKLKHQIFPEEYFDTRIEAMHERVEGRAAKKFESDGPEGGGSADDDDACSVDDSSESYEERQKMSDVSSQDGVSSEDDTLLEDSTHMLAIEDEDRRTI